MRAGLAEPHAADVGFVDLAAHEHLLDVAERHHQRGVGAEVEDRRHRAADLDVAREHGAANRRPDRGVGQLLVGALGGGLRLRHVAPRLGDLGLADDQLRLRGALAVLGDCSSSAVGLVERRLRDQLLVEQRLRALVGAARERDVGRLRPRSRSSSSLRLGAVEGAPRRPAGWPAPRAGGRSDSPCRARRAPGRPRPR